MEINKNIESDNDVANDINPLIEKGILIVNTPSEDKHLVELIESNFNFIGSKIADKYEYSIVKCSDLAKLSDKQAAEIVQSHILKEGTKFNLLDRIFGIVGDSYMNYSYIGVLKEIIPHISVFITLPQHTYFVCDDGQFVFCHTFENDFIFYKAVE